MSLKWREKFSCNIFKLERSNYKVTVDLFSLVLFYFHFKYKVKEIYHLCGLVVRVPSCRSRGLGFHSRCHLIFPETVGVEWGPLSHLRITKELLE
jgi:hypothetical protein